MPAGASCPEVTGSISSATLAFQMIAVLGSGRL